MSAQPTKLVTFSTLYPNSVQPRHGLFVEHRLRQLLATDQVASKVIAPVPWFPFSWSLFGSYATFARVPSTEVRHGIEVSHPRYPLIPKIGMTSAPLLMARAAKPAFDRLRRAGHEFHAIDAHYFYPDGVAAAMIGQQLRRPVVITARGTDVNLIMKYRWPRRQILWAADRCETVITVCRALKDELVEHGLNPKRIEVLRNGVDLELFRPVEREEALAMAGFHAPTLLSVGALIERKGHHIAIEALSQLPGVRLAIIGQGPMESTLRRLASRLHLTERVSFLGAVNQDRLRFFYSAADALVLASNREGMANVLLESLACGTPVVATRVWGTPEVVVEPIAGVLMERRDAGSLARAFRSLVDRYPRRSDVRRYAEGFSWDATTDGQLRIFRKLSH